MFMDHFEMNNVESLGCTESAAYSPCGKFLVVAQKTKLTVLLTSTNNVIHEVNCSGYIDRIHWSNNSIHILCVCKERHQVDAFSLKQPNWTCRITTGLEGIEDAAWSPDGSCILTLSQFNVRLRIWSLNGKAVGSIGISRLLCDNLLSFSGCGRFMVASLTEHPCKIQVFNTKTWEREKELIAQFDEPQWLAWSPVGDFLALHIVPDLRVCNVTIFSSASGKQVGQFQREKSKNKLRGSRLLSWSPSGQLLAVGCFDGTIFILDHILWSPLAKLKHSAILDQDRCVIYKKECDIFNLVENRPVCFTAADRKLVSFSPGLKLLAFDYQTQHLASVDESMPAVVWIWKMEDLSLECVLTVEESVVSLAWSTSGILAICDISGFTILRRGAPEYIKMNKQTELNLTKLAWRPMKHTGPPQLVVQNSNAKLHIFSAE